VRLSGNVETWKESHRAVAIARGAAGAKSVDNQMTVD